ncbi:MAG: outer membrane lipopolysaccharide assembly protein LptE/RlpB [Planctomycetota bacterium]|jgi:outer membrane lipopolysaccharide assembly protein LptE/RlpB
MDTFPRTLITIALLTALLSGCGFKLAGTAELPLLVKQIYVQAEDLNSGQKSILVAQLKQAGAVVSTEKSSANATLSVAIKTLPDRRLVASANSAKTVNRISRRLDFNLQAPDGSQLISNRQINEQQDVELDSNNLLASSEAKADVVQNLERALITRMIGQLKRL